MSDPISPSSESLETSLNSLSLNDPNFSVRLLAASDYSKGFLQLLSQLTEVGEISPESFAERFEFVSKLNSSYFVLVIEDLSTSKIIGSATLLVEHKFIHSCGKVGHIEDVVVDSTYRGRNLGLKLIESLVQIARKQKCYKVLLDCDVKNIPFYEKIGFSEKERHMALYFGKL